MEVFKEYYETKTKHRKLTWIYPLGSVTMKANFNAKPIELIISTFQAAMLMLFNEGAALNP